MGGDHADAELEPGLPRYLTIENALRAEIARLRPGDSLPTEAELCERFGVSRMTAREGVRRLVDQGLLYRVRGRGTFVARTPVHRQPGRLLSFSEEMRARGLRPSSRILEISQQIAAPEVARALNLEPGARAVLVRRERLADDLPMALERTLLIPECAAVLGADLESGSLHAALEALGRTPSVARGTIAPQAATADDATAFGVARGTPLLVETRVVYESDDVPIEHTETRYSPTRYVLDIELHRTMGHPRVPSAMRALPRASG
jgi:GntR family transcriptional regulator